MTKRVTFLLLLAAVSHVACGGKDTVPAPSPTTPSPSTFSLTGQVTNSTTSTGIAVATVSIADGVNAGKSATTDASGNYSLTALQQAGFTVNATAGAYVASSQSVTLTSNQTLNFALVQQSFAGNWSGTTQQGNLNGRPSITFTVNSANALTALTMSFTSVCGGGGSNFLGALPAITNSSFTWSDSRPIGTYSWLFRTVKGTFGSDSTAAGTATIEMNARSCAGPSLNLVWTATKQ